MRLNIVQQCRAEDLDAVRATYARLGVAAEVASFFADLPARIAASHLVVSRSGASTVAELSAIGRPAILVPLPHVGISFEELVKWMVEDASLDR